MKAGSRGAAERGSIPLCPRVVPAAGWTPLRVRMAEIRM